MKKTILMCAILSLGTVTASTASAASFEVSDETKRNSVVWGSIATGAAIGGPLGALIGTIAGSWLGERVKEAGQIDDIEQALAKANARSDELSQKLAETVTPAPTPEHFVFESLKLELLFKTGNSQLTEAGTEKIKNLARLMKQHPELHVRLDGHADPRGAADYNQALSENRVQTVAGLLENQGVSRERIASYAYGSSQSSAAKNDYDAYALERVVKVQLAKQTSQDSYAQND